MVTVSNKRAAAFSLLSFLVVLHPLHGCALRANQTSPYGKDFVGHKATGRFSNGKIPSDMIGDFHKVANFTRGLPAYLGTDLSSYDLITGVSFASGGCGFDPLTSQLVVSFIYFLLKSHKNLVTSLNSNIFRLQSAISLDQQLNLFMEYKQKVKAIVGEKRAEYITSNSAYFIIAGTNDLANTYFATPFRKFEFDLPSYINFTVQSASTLVQKLYHSGARKIGIAGVPPIGCLPSQRTLAGGIERTCSTTYNQAATSFNSRLSKQMQRLNNILHKAKILYIDIYTPLLELILHPSKYGFVESKRGCCGTGTFEVTQTCNSLTTFVCEDASNYVFWDSYHPTERAYNILVKKLAQKYGASLN